jgi:excisionase family DNA binding protein
MNICSTGLSREQRRHLKPLTVTVKTALELLGIGRTTIYELIDQGIVKTTKIGRRRLVVYSSLEAITCGRSAAAQKPDDTKEIAVKTNDN